MPALGGAVLPGVQALGAATVAPGMQAFGAAIASRDAGAPDALNMQPFGLAAAPGMQEFGADAVQAFIVQRGPAELQQHAYNAGELHDRQLQSGGT